VRLLKGNSFCDTETIAEAVRSPTMKFVATETSQQLDLQALHRVRERVVSQRAGIINQIRAFLLERGIAVKQGYDEFVPLDILSRSADHSFPVQSGRVRWQPVALTN
jgi:transposase